MKKVTNTDRARKLLSVNKWACGQKDISYFKLIFFKANKMSEQGGNYKGRYPLACGDEMAPTVTKMTQRGKKIHQHLAEDFESGLLW